MYSAPHSEGDQIPRIVVVGIHDDAVEVDLLPEDIAGYWHFQLFANAVRQADGQVISDVVRMYEARHNLHLAALRVENRPLLWKNDQLKPGPIEILRSYPLTPRGKP